MLEVAELLHQLIPHLAKPPRFITYQQAFLESVQLDPHVASAEDLAACATARGINIDGEMSVQAWRDLLLTHCVEASFPDDQLTFLYHYPAAQCALAKVINDNGHDVAQRFEVYLGALELGNGYQEQTDAALNRQVLEQDAQQRGHDVLADERFLGALAQGLPDCAGVAVGIDRVLMSRLQLSDIKQVISFPWEVA